MSTAVDTTTPWLAAARSLDRWMAARDYAGHDPHDFLASGLVRATTLGSRWAAVAWTQAGRRLPVQLRPALRVPKARNAKGIGLVLAAQVRLAEAEADDPGGKGDAIGSAGDRAARARELVAWLDSTADRSHGGAGWGYPFPWANRDFMAPAGTPSSVATAFIGHALLDAADRLGMEEARQLAAEAVTFLTTALHRIPGADDTFCFSYTPLDGRAVHNASLLAASLIARLDTPSHPEDPGGLIGRVVGFTLRAQRDDGAWPYGAGRRNQWVDSFHTGYLLLALDMVGRRVAVPGLDAAVDRGVAYWRSAFFAGPAVGFHPGERYPVDAHAVAQAILTFLGLRHRIPDGPAEAQRLGAWAIRAMRDPSGYFHYRHHGRWRNRLPYMRWVQSWMLLALSELSLTPGPSHNGDG